MTKSLFFDTLDYAKKLAAGEVAHADVHAKALSRALSHNLYTKGEVENMLAEEKEKFREALERFDKRTDKILARSDQKFLEMKQEILQAEIRFEKAANRNLITTIGVLGSLIVLVGSLATFAHHLI